jgi:hypothetical protein
MNRRSTLLLLVVAAASLGCSDSLDATVVGTVSLDGKPVGPGVVTFVPVEGSQPNPASGPVQPNGTYALKTSRTEGLTPGKYKASVSIWDQPEVPKGERSMITPKLITPEKYADPETSGLEYQVDPGDNTIDLTLTST